MIGIHCVLGLSDLGVKYINPGEVKQVIIWWTGQSAATILSKQTNYSLLLFLLVLVLQCSVSFPGSFGLGTRLSGSEAGVAVTVTTQLVEDLLWLMICDKAEPKF